MILLVWDVRNAATCLGFFLSLLIRTDTDTDTDTSSCFIWVLLNFYLFFYICHVLNINIEFIGWYIMYFCHPIFFFLQKFTTWHIDHHPILFFLFNSKQNTESKHNRIITHTEVTADGWRQFFSKQWRVLVGSLFCCYGKTGSCRREKLAWRCLKLLCQ